MFIDNLLCLSIIAHNNAHTSILNPVHNQSLYVAGTRTVVLHYYTSQHRPAAIHIQITSMVLYVISILSI